MDETEKARLEARAESGDRARRDAARQVAVSFAEGQVTAGRVLPADQDGLVAVLAHLDAAPLEEGEAETISFGEGDAAKSLTPAAWLRDFIGRLPAQVDYGTRSGADTPTGSRCTAARRPTRPSTT